MRQIRAQAAWAKASGRRYVLLVNDDDDDADGIVDLDDVDLASDDDFAQLTVGPIYGGGGGGAFVTGSVR